MGSASKVRIGHSDMLDYPKRKDQSESCQQCQEPEGQCRELEAVLEGRDQKRLPGEASMNRHLLRVPPPIVMAPAMVTRTTTTLTGEGVELMTDATVNPMISPSRRLRPRPKLKRGYVLVQSHRSDASDSTSAMQMMKVRNQRPHQRPPTPR